MPGPNAPRNSPTYIIIVSGSTYGVCITWEHDHPFVQQARPGQIVRVWPATKKVHSKVREKFQYPHEYVIDIARSTFDIIDHADYVPFAICFAVASQLPSHSFVNIVGRLTSAESLQLRKVRDGDDMVESLSVTLTDPMNNTATVVFWGKYALDAANDLDSGIWIYVRFARVREGPSGTWFSVAANEPPAPQPVVSYPNPNGQIFKQDLDQMRRFSPTTAVPVRETSVGSVPPSGAPGLLLPVAGQQQAQQQPHRYFQQQQQQHNPQQNVTANTAQALAIVAQQLQQLQTVLTSLSAPFARGAF